METFGILGNGARGWLRHIARHSSGGEGDWPQFGKIRQYYERIAVAVQAHNAQMIRDWVTTGSTPILGGGGGAAHAG